MGEIAKKEADGTILVLRGRSKGWGGIFHDLSVASSKVMGKI
jgi:hypothetical protein